MKTRLHIALLLLCCGLFTTNGLRAQNLLNTKWLLVGASAQALSGESVDSLQMALMPGNAIQLQAVVNGTTQDTERGIWNQIDASHYWFVDTTTVPGFINTICPSADTSTVTYSISTDTLTMSNFQSSCGIFAALLTGSQWKQVLPTGTGISTVVKASGLKVYPNPVTDVLNLQLQQAYMCSTTVGLYDFAGRKVYEAVLPAGQTTLQLSNLKGLARGSYALELRPVSGEALIMRRVVLGE